MLAGVGEGWRMRTAGAEIAPNELFIYSCTTVVAIGILVWLSGGVGSPYCQLFLLSALYASAVHPARRVAVFLCGFAVMALLPLFYTDGVSRRAATEHSVEVVVWLALALAIAFLMHNVRAQRLGLRREHEQARRQARVGPLTGPQNRRGVRRTP